MGIKFQSYECPILIFVDHQKSFFKLSYPSEITSVHGSFEKDRLAISLSQESSLISSSGALNPTSDPGHKCRQWEGGEYGGVVERGFYYFYFVETLGIMKI